jgi:hypothetical protein
MEVQVKLARLLIYIPQIQVQAQARREGREMVVVRERTLIKVYMDAQYCELGPTEQKV